MSRPRNCASTMERRRRACSSSGGMRESAGVGGRFHAEVLERKRRQFGDAPRRRVYANGEQGDLRVGGGEGAVAAPAQVAAPGEIGELDTVSGRDEQLSSVRVAERRPGALQGIRL